VQVGHFDFDGNTQATGFLVFAHFLHSGRYATGGADVVFLDQCHVVETKTVVVATACQHRVFVQPAQVGGGFAGVQHAQVGSTIALRCVHKTVGGRGNARGPLQQVKGDAFGLQQARFMVSSMAA